MNVFLMVLRARKPSQTSDMPASAHPFLIKKGYEALTFFGHIVTHSAQEAEAFNQRFGSLKNHEMIHLYQARATHDSWFCFYLLYGWYWLQACRYRRHLKNAGYLLNPFELEAYRHMANLGYLNGKAEATEWRRFARMSLHDRLRYVVT